jgi:hypothetical protein
VQSDNGWKELSRCLGNVIGPNIVAAATVGIATEWGISVGVVDSSRRRHRLRALGRK